jgi:hypothetical protein
MRGEREYGNEEWLALMADAVPPVLGCCDIKVLMDVAMEQASPEMIARVERHCEQCPTCQGRLTVYRATVADEEVDERPAAGTLIERLAHSIGKKPAVSPPQDTGIPDEHRR